MKDVRVSVVEERTIRVVAIAAKGHLDEVGAGVGADCQLVGHLEVESPQDQDLEPGGLRCPPKAGIVLLWRWAVGGERKRLVKKEV